jgi:hypothetical protein
MPARSVDRARSAEFRLASLAVLVTLQTACMVRVHDHDGRSHGHPPGSADPGPDAQDPWGGHGDGDGLWGDDCARTFEVVDGTSTEVGGWLEGTWSAGPNGQGTWWAEWIPGAEGSVLHGGFVRGTSGAAGTIEGTLEETEGGLWLDAEGESDAEGQVRIEGLIQTSAELRGSGWWSFADARVDAVASGSDREGPWVGTWTWEDREGTVRGAWGVEDEEGWLGATFAVEGWEGEFLGAFDETGEGYAWDGELAGWGRFEGTAVPGSAGEVTTGVGYPYGCGIEL